MLRRALADSEIDEGESNEIFITLGAGTFAAALPFGLLLYRAGPVGMSMMHLAPLVTLGGMPMLACGALLWRKVKQKELAIARMVGTSIALLGMVIVLAGMILAWPNPASVVPAAPASLFFAPPPIVDLAGAKRSDLKKFAKFFHGCLERGVYFAPSQFETGFISSAHTPIDIEQTVTVVRETLCSL